MSYETERFRKISSMEKFGVFDFNLNLERFDFKLNFGSRAWGTERG